MMLACPIVIETNALSQAAIFHTYTCYFQCISTFKMKIMANVQVKCEMVDIFHPQWSPAWLPSGRGGAANLFLNL